MKCSICGFVPEDYENLRVDEKISKILSHIQNLASGKGETMFTGLEEKKIRYKHTVALENCTGIMELIGKEKEEKPSMMIDKDDELYITSPKIYVS